MTDINERIAIAREPKPIGYIEESKGISPKGAWVCPFWDWFDYTWHPADYSHDWRLAGMLLEELPTDIRMQCMIGNTDEIKMRIAEAWLAWKERKG